MGNCINVLSSSQKKVHVLDFNGGKEGLKSDAQGLSSPPKSKIEEGKAFTPVTLMANSESSSVSSNRSSSKRLKGRKVKIVVTKEQLEFMMKNVKKLKSRGVFFTFPGNSASGETCEKWKPFLATIPEVQNF